MQYVTISLIVGIEYQLRRHLLFINMFQISLYLKGFSCIVNNTKQDDKSVKLKSFQSTPRFYKADILRAKMIRTRVITNMLRVNYYVGICVSTLLYKIIKNLFAHNKSPTTNHLHNMLIPQIWLVLSAKSCLLYKRGPSGGSLPPGR